MRISFIYVLFLCNIVTCSTVGNLCTNSVGTKCACIYSNAGSLFMNCTRLSLAVVPSGIQKDVTALDFQQNVITAVEFDSFAGLGLLERLFLSNNLIYRIALGAFDKLFKLQTLDLQNNKLTVVEAGHFHHLPSLVFLDLSNNKITTFARDSILYLPKLGQLAINGNPLRCDCEMRAFRQSITARQGNLLVISAQCNGTSVKMTDAPESLFGSCQGDDLFKSITCMDCKNVRSSAECKQKNLRTECGTNRFTRPACYEELNYVTSQLIINKGCTDYVPCLDTERNNADLCYTNSSAICRFCCVGELCNKPSLRDRLHSSIYIVTVTLQTFLNSSLLPGSPTFSNFVTVVQSTADNSLNNKPTSFGSFRTYQTSIGPGRDKVILQIEYNTVMEVNRTSRGGYISSQIFALKSLYSLPIAKVEVLVVDKPCLSDVTNDDKGQFQWDSVYPGEEDDADCPGKPGTRASRNCSVNSSGVPVWEVPDTSSCPYVNTLTQSLNNLANTQINTNNADTVRKALLNLTKESSNYSDVDVSLSVNIVERLLTEGSVYKSAQKSHELVQSMSNIMNSPDAAVTQSASINRTTERFVQAVDRLGNAITSGDFTSVNDNLALMVRQTDPNNFNGITMAATVTPDTNLNANQIQIKDGEDPSSMVSGVVVPASLFETAGKNSPRLSFAVYGSNKMFQTVSTTSLGSPLGISKDLQEKNAVNGPVIATSVQNTNVKGLQKPMLLRFQHFNQNSERPQCAFVNTTGPKGMEWSTQGCRVKNHVKGRYTDCECDHMTNFALLMDIYQTGGSLSLENRLALTYISYIGCAVSLLGLLFTLLTYLLFRKLRVNNPSKILINLCIALAVSNIIFLVGMQEYTLDNVTGCKIVAVSLHYVLLSAMCWMLVEAFYMYLALIKVFNTYFSHFLLKCCLFGWGVPLIIVAITLGVNETDNYGQQAGGICWLAPIPFYAAFLAPVGLILILNFITFVLVFKTLVKGSSKKLTKSDNKNSIAQRLRGAIALIILLGLTWAFAIFAIDSGGIVFQYLFTIFNSLQGFFIFVFYCLLKTDAQQAWRKKLGCPRPDYSGPTSTSKGNTTSNTFNSEQSDSKKDFTDLSKEIEANYPETKIKGKSKRYPSYTESNT